MNALLKGPKEQRLTFSIHLSGRQYGRMRAIHKGLRMKLKGNVQNSACYHTFQIFIRRNRKAYHKDTLRAISRVIMRIVYSALSPSSRVLLVPDRLYLSVVASSTEKFNRRSLKLSGNVVCGHSQTFWLRSYFSRKASFRLMSTAGLPFEC